MFSCGLIDHHLSPFTIYVFVKYRYVHEEPL